MRKRKNRVMNTGCMDLFSSVFSNDIIGESIKDQIEADIKAIYTNYRLTQEDNFAGSIANKFSSNLKAIQILKSLSPDRMIEVHERASLAKYCGWGGMPKVFFPYERKETLSVEEEVWFNRQKELKNNLNEEEFKRIQSSIDSAFYTPHFLIQSIWQQVQRFGFKGGKVLEPAMATGNFFGLMPENLMEKSTLYGVEIDSISGSIAKNLYPNAKIDIAGFQDSKYSDNFFDLVIGNVPFGNYPVHDPRYNQYNFQIHNYFFAKALDLVRPGGLVAFVTSLSTMENMHDGRVLREMINEKGNFIGAVRLPSLAFNDANTQTATDIIFLHKKLAGQISSNIAWTDTVEIPLKTSRECKPHESENLKMNEYFVREKDMLLGIPVEGHYKKNLSIKAFGSMEDLQNRVNNAMLKMPTNIFKDRQSINVEKEAPSKETNTWGGSFSTVGDKVFQNVGGESVAIEKNADRIYQMVQIATAAENLLAYQLYHDGDSKLFEYQSDLGQKYDWFVKRFGVLNLNANKRAFAGDQNLGLLLALETKNVKTGRYEKSDIFYKRTIRPNIKAMSCDSTEDGLKIVLHECGFVDLNRLCELVRKTESEVLTDLKGLIYYDPQKEKYVTADEYLSGKVKEKLTYAEVLSENQTEYRENVEALRNVQPEPLEYKDIYVSIGASWIPASYMKEFMEDILELSNEEVIQVTHLPKVAEWIVEVPNNKLYDQHIRGNIKNIVTWGTERKPFLALMRDALSQTRPVVRDKKIDPEKGKEIYVINEAQTLLAAKKLEEIKVRFSEWVWEESERRQTLARLYNDQFNNCRLRTYDGSHLTLPGLSTDIELYPHQKDAIWRILSCNGNVLLGHDVGLGKTFSMQVATMELRRLKIANKPMHIVLTSTFEDYVNSFRRAYPAVKLLAISSNELPPLCRHVEVDISRREAQRVQEEVNRMRRLAMLMQIMTGDWDAIVISHEIFKRLAVSPELENEFISEQIEEMENAIWQLEANDSPSYVVKRIETQKKRLECKLKRDFHEMDRDIGICFEKLGIDYIFVDEADMFKNLYFSTQMVNIAGVTNTGSQRSADMFLKISYLNKIDKHVVFATGTPISNSIAEMYTLMRYLIMDELRQRNIAHFDAWAATFGEVVNTLERSPDGSTWRAVQRFANFINMPELITLFRSFADIKTADDVNLKRPELVGGKRQVITAPASEELKHYVKNTIMERVKAIKKGVVPPNVDNMLVVTSDMRKASLDFRLVDRNSKFLMNSKVGLLIQEVYKTWEMTTEEKAVQVIFCDLSTPKADKVSKEIESDKALGAELPEEQDNVIIYHEIKKLLIDRGIPAEEIAFIHDAKTNKQKYDLFQKLNAGIKRIILGSTSKLGVGNNFQKRLLVEHHLDCPWRPRDILQREGRILRQGNQYESVYIKAYVTEESADAWLWQIVKQKAKFIAQALSGNFTARKLEDISNTVLGFAEIEALATGNPLIIDKIRIDKEVNELSIRKASWKSNIMKMKDAIFYLPKRIETLKEKIELFRKDVAVRQDISGENFAIVLEGNRITNRETAQTVLNVLADKYKKFIGETQVHQVQIGEIAGFTLSMQFLQNNLFEPDLVIYGHSSYDCTISVKSLEIAVRTGPEKVLNNHLAALEKAEKEMTNLNKELVKPFDGKDQLAAALIRQKEIYVALGIDKAQDDTTFCA